VTNNPNLFTSKVEAHHGEHAHARDTTPIRDDELVMRLDAALDFNAQTGIDAEWSELLTQAMNARNYITYLQTRLERYETALKQIACFEPFEGDDTPPHTQIAITTQSIAREALGDSH
jgi:hypothetical protein